MSFIEKFRIKRTHPKTVNQSVPRFAPGWLAEQQRTVLRVLSTALVVSMTGNIFQFWWREQIADKPPEVVGGFFDYDYSSMKVMNVKDLSQSQLEAAARAEVKRLVYRLRRVDSTMQVQEAIESLYCSVTGDGAIKANRSFERGQTAELLRKGQKRILSEKTVRAGLKPGQRANFEDGVWVGAAWKEEIDAGARREKVEVAAEFKVQQFKDLSGEIRDCNPLGLLIVDYELFGTE